MVVLFLGTARTPIVISDFRFHAVTHTHSITKLVETEIREYHNCNFMFKLLSNIKTV